MKHIKSERLKKLESELSDLEQWLKLGLVPSKDMAKHKIEIQAVKDKIDEEKERLKFLKESGELEEYSTPKRPTGRTAYTELPSLPDIDMGETAGHISEAGFDMGSETAEVDTSSIIEDHDDSDEEGEEEEEVTEVVTREESVEEDEDNKDDLADDESYFSDRNRWRRGGIVDPDANEW